MSDVKVEHNPGESRFEVIKDGHLARLDYLIEGQNIRYTHTIVPEELGGQGIAKALVLTGLHYARDNSMGVIPQCPFVRGYIERHSEWEDLVVPNWEPI